ncbi:MAG: tRNA adenosine(34) deaminase TadA [Planctomycetes bacterium]|nr:tRNA adenosine(34) deaminase TadA [Planctomycetota bacterium]
MNDDDRFMLQALREARDAAEDGEVPVGAVVVCGGRVIGRGHNQREMLHDPTAHAEMIAITAAAGHLESWRLEECVLYVTLEPCAMCAGAIVLARLPRLVFGAFDPKAGACGSVLDIVREPRFNHRVEPEGGVLAEECGHLLKEFFKARRTQVGGNGQDSGPGGDPLEGLSG